jgi:hypothetical protein
MARRLTVSPSNVLIAAGLTDDRSQQNLLTTFRPRSSPTCAAGDLNQSGRARDAERQTSKRAIFDSDAPTRTVTIPDLPPRFMMRINSTLTLTTASANETLWR